ncbi:Retrovirus-related Pol polyprotein [Stylophora pistillata]|uniref:Retrovirus-related Pol polyprotein n=1 Tax=Stylophora pistillata TaxID=50429 RepID=A0A2B4SMK4_STYPI|nr:Retrovirus-related Pol polyprotein [Stylophora pistillata]
MAEGNSRTPGPLLLDANAAENWRKFFIQLEIFLVARGKDNKADKLKVNLLLHCAGPEAIEEYSHFVFTGEEDKDCYQDVCRKFEELCQGAKNVSSTLVIDKRKVKEKNTPLSKKDVRICIDARDLNKALNTPHYPMVTVEEVANRISGAKSFMSLDACSGYWQFPVDDESSKLLTFNTPWGRFRFTRLPFGISSAPDIYHREMDKLFEGVPVEIIVDDFLIHGKDQIHTDQKLRRVLARSREVGLKFNPKKVKLRVPEKDMAFVWEKPQQEAFDKLKSVITSSPVLAYFNNSKETVLCVDASSTGLGVVIKQEGKLVAFSSKTLTPSEKMYANIDRELLVIVWGVQKFLTYAYGRKIIVERDHKPSESSFGKPLNEAPPRLQRMLLKLTKYDLVVHYVPGKQQVISDCLSRAPLSETKPFSEPEDVIGVNLVEEFGLESSTLKRIKKSSSGDETSRVVMEYVLRGWPSAKEQVDELAWEYWSFREELSVEDVMLFKSDRIVVPRPLRAEVPDEIHGAHMGESKNLSFARDYVFWPSMTAQIKDKVSSCAVCNAFRNRQQKETLHPHDIPGLPWQVVGTDLFESSGQTYLAAERAVQTEKRILKKAAAENKDPFEGLLKYRNTPFEDIGVSPVQLLMSRRTRTMIPTHQRLLLPQPVDRDDVLKTLDHRQHNAKSNYDKQSSDLPPLDVGDRVRFRPNGEKEWRKAEIMPRSYMLIDEYGGTYNRNRRHIIAVPNDSPMTPRARALPTSTQPHDSLASTRPAPALEKPASSPVSSERQTETIEPLPLEPDLGVELGGRRHSLSHVRGEML